jgi:hypothetical protein
LEKKIHSTGQHVITTLFHSKGYLIFGGYDQKVYIYKKEKEKKIFSVPENIWRIHELVNKNILIGFHLGSGGAAIYDLKGKLITKFDVYW